MQKGVQFGVTKIVTKKTKEVLDMLPNIGVEPNPIRPFRIPQIKSWPRPMRPSSPSFPSSLKLSRNLTHWKVHGQVGGPGGRANNNTIQVADFAWHEMTVAKTLPPNSAKSVIWVLFGQQIVKNAKKNQSAGR